MRGIYVATTVAVLACGTALTLPGRAGASDGAIEINQVAALAGGVTATDSAGFPVTLDSPGNYVLTGTLTTLVGNVNGIDITSADVTLDLNGFSLIGPGVAAFGFFGINGNGNDRTTVKNGNVLGFGWRGIQLAFDCHIDHVVSSDHDDAGIICNSQAIIQNSVANKNGTGGISAGARSVVKDNVAYLNGRKLAAAGISAGVGSVVSGNVSNQNEGIGIDAGGASTVTGNSAEANKMDGIRALGDSLVTGNSSVNNNGWGLNLQTSTGYSNNVIRSGFGAPGTVSAGGVNLGHNLCDGNTICP